MRYRQKRSFSARFKREAVEYSLDSPQTQVEIAGKLGIHPNVLSRWRRELLMNGDSGKPVVKNRGPEKSARQLERENARLRKRLERVELEKEILKKAQEYFAKNPE